MMKDAQWFCVGRNVAGARHAGVRSVWLNRNGSGARPGMTPDAEIASLVGLVEIL
jgi:FMN phosphatase YigB (HAD superfamily)